MARNPTGGGGRVGWGVTSLILLADMLGLGALAMPAAFARLGGFVPATAAIIVLGCVAAYSGSLYARLMSVPLPREKAGGQAYMLDEIADEALGVVGRFLSYLLADLLIILSPVVTLIAAVESLQQVLRGVHKSWHVDLELNRLYCSLIVAAVVLPLLQARKLRDLSYALAVGAVSILAALTIIILKLVWLDGQQPEPGAEPRWAAPVPLMPAAVGAMDVLFGFAGQGQWPRFITAMRPPRTHFVRATSATIPIVGASLLAIGAVGYWRLGEDFDFSKPVSSVLRQDGWLVAANVGVLVQSIVATVLNLNTWVWSVMAMCIKTANRRRRGSSYERLRADPEPSPPGIEEGLPAVSVVYSEVSVVYSEAESMHTPLMSDEPGTPRAFVSPALEPAGAGAVAGEVPVAWRLDPNPVFASRWPWLALSIVGLSGAAVAAYLLPCFAEVMALVGSLTDTTVMVTLPALFALLLLPKHMVVSHWEWGLMLGLMVLSITAAVFGCAASIHQIQQQLRQT